MPPNRSTFLLVAVAVLACTAACANAIRSKDVLDKFNGAKPEKPPFMPVAREVSDITRQSLVDAYYSSSCVTSLLEPPDTAAQIASALECASKAEAPDAEDECFHHLFKDLRLPPPPAPEQRNPRTWALEQDVTRLGVNLKQLIRSVVAYHKTSQLGGVEKINPQVLGGLETGLHGFREYQNARHVSRDRAHAITTLVMSGGAANGAYTAGATWWLLGRLDACRSAAEARLAQACPGREAACLTVERAKPENACLEDHVDMVAGTSTGAAISILVKDYFSERENARRRALDLLTKNYTCTTNSDLYCVTDTGLGDLGVDEGGKALGLVRFSGLAKILDQNLDEKTLGSVTEYFVSTVEYQTGRALHLSSANPHDIPTVRALKEAVLSSTVEPGLAEPVTRIGNLRGVLIDGGVRSGLPVSTPLRRGAERAVLFVNAPLEPRPLNAAPPNAIAMGMRTLDLFAHQPILGELHQAEYELATRRTLEYELCVERLLSPPAPPDTPVPPRCTYAGLENTTLKPLPADRPQVERPVRLSGPHFGKAPNEEIQKLCMGDLWPSDASDQAMELIQQPPTQLPRSASRAYRSVWFFQPHLLPSALEGPNPVEPGISWDELSAAGYSFDPKLMWKLFVFGAAVGNQRCREIDSTLGWHLKDWCGGVEELRAELSPLRKRAQLQCWNRDPSHRLCGKSDTVEFKD